MSDAARALHLMSADEFLDTRPTDRRVELVGGVVYAMSGGTDRHNIVAVNAAIALGPPARRLACQLFVNDMALQIDERTVYYPDVMAVCDFDGDPPLKRTRPCLIIEVLSPSTSLSDQREKRIAYERIASMRDYFMVNPNDGHVDHHYRVDTTTWGWQVLNVADVVETTCLGPLAVGDLYVGL